MVEVTQNSSSGRQSSGGCISPLLFDIIELDDNIKLNNTENIGPEIVEKCVEFLTKFILRNKAENAQASSEEALNQINIKGTDDESVICACRLAADKLLYRGQLTGVMHSDKEPADADEDTISNIRTMTNRSVDFFSKHGPVKEESIVLVEYGDIASKGYGDFLTEDTLWEFDASENPISSKQTLQLMMYWIMSRHSGQKIYSSIKNIGLFNPRLNRAYILDVEKVPKETIRYIEENIICY